MRHQEREDPARDLPNYFWEAGMFLGQCWFVADGIRYNPSLCFIQQSPRTGKDVRLIHRPAEAVGELHSYSMGAVDWLYDESGTPPIEVGFIDPASLSTGVVIAPGGEPASE